jgi:predicted HTH domain antitoxin
MAGLSHSEMIDELGRRSIPVVRYPPEELAREVEVLRGTVGR